METLCNLLDLKEIPKIFQYGMILSKMKKKKIVMHILEDFKNILKKSPNGTKLCYKLKLTESSKKFPS